ncbi:ArnT family glycosyltransferase [Jatrophihabitans lederbergiae]|uniref:Glycosyltransferase family 39 protein n=1 Tax=Jatrophihabitans lederbergiae TaxID=3075547 RepID=A0ABU2JAP6_9ACTN|nr:glycosyltransferase family 39 protein [Jatrophihabitans sp. DSM 44399]MDT0262066.1 glycosyltransferase family 39 protein [Jatrophihabitans sp. DSM 44399]
MTTLDERPSSATAIPAPGDYAARGRWPSFGRAQLVGAVALLAVLALLVLTHVRGLAGSPSFEDDEGTYVSQAWSVLVQHRLAPYTYWYDHPPLGWIQLAGWFGLTGGLNHGAAVLSARWFALVCAVLTAALTWLVARRAGVGRIGATMAVLALAVSPLAVVQQRLALLDNTAMPWLLGSFALVLSPRRRMWAAAGAGACFAVAVLTKETTLLFAPALAVAVLAHADRRTRSFTVTAITSSAVLLLIFYPLYAALKGELLPGSGHVSLFDAIRFQLYGRPSTGNPLAADSLGHQVVLGWLDTDRVLPITGVLAAVALLFLRRLRFVAVAVLLPVLFALRPGYLPMAYVIGLLPFLALAVGAVFDLLVSAGMPRAATNPLAATDSGSHRRQLTRAASALLACAAVVAAAGYVAPKWSDADTYVAHQNANDYTLTAENWVSGHLAHRSRIIVDNSVWTDLVRRGFNPNLGVIWMYKLDYATNLDPSVRRALPAGWRDCDYVLVTPVLRAAVSNTPGGLPEIRDALNHSRLVTSFGTGADRVELRKLLKTGI